MVRAILEGRKTQTRRIVKPQIPNFIQATPDRHPPKHAAPYLDAYCSQKKTAANPRGMSLDWCWWTRDDRPSVTVARCPYGIPGDQLWVRENFMLESNYGLDNEKGYPPPFNDGRPIKRESSPDYGDWWTQAHYAATDPKPELCRDSDDDRMAGWKPSIHMPRWASRITLEITGIRCERLRQITGIDAHAEGCPYPHPSTFPIEQVAHAHSNTVHWYSDIWESINGPGSWEANHWVWVLQFRKVTP